MKKIFILFMLCCSFLFADLKNIEASPSIIESGIKIIDIRTAPEWKETGIVKNSIPITFFDERGKYDVVAFLNKLNMYVDKSKTFALICRTGNRTSIVSKFLDEQGYKVINLEGGVVSLSKQGYKLVPYK